MIGCGYHWFGHANTDGRFGFGPELKQLYPTSGDSYLSGGNFWWRACCQGIRRLYVLSRHRWQKRRISARITGKSLTRRQKEKSIRSPGSHPWAIPGKGEGSAFAAQGCHCGWYLKPYLKVGLRYSLQPATRAGEQETAAVVKQGPEIGSQAGIIEINIDKQLEAIQFAGRFHGFFENGWISLSLPGIRSGCLWFQPEYRVLLLFCRRKWSEMEIPA